ncbi:unnamed protein product, partial [Brassica rapa subsp. narinosa]
AELHQRSSQFKGAVRWSGKAARLRSGFLDQRFFFRFPRSTSCPCCRRARGSVGVLLQLRSTSLRSGVANGGVVDLRWFGDVSVRFSHRRCLLMVKALQSAHGGILLPSSGGSSGFLPVFGFHTPSVFCSGCALVDRSAFCSSGSGTGCV